MLHTAKKEENIRNLEANKASPWNYHFTSDMNSRVMRALRYWGKKKNKNTEGFFWCFLNLPPYYFCSQHWWDDRMDTSRTAFHLKVTGRNVSNVRGPLTIYKISHTKPEAFWILKVSVLWGDVSIYHFQKTTGRSSTAPTKDLHHHTTSHFHPFSLLHQQCL